MAKVQKRPGTDLFPVPTVMVSCIGADGKPNIITLAWVGTVCSTPPMVSIAIRPGRYSHRLIGESKEFVINIPSESHLWEMDYCGNVSGRDVDKFAAAKLTPEKASIVRPPLIAECPVNLECQVRQVLPLGTHDLFIGEVVAVHVLQEACDESGRIDPAKARPITYNHGDYWSLKERVGRYGFSKKESRPKGE